jgi:hypothetical protein
MGYPELDRDESIILEAKNVKFKSISFDARLTNRRIILIDSRKNIIPPQEILLATIWQVDAGENAIRDHLLSITILNNAGEKDQIVLTFPRLAGAERKRECNDWAKKLQSLIHPSTAPSEPAPVRTEQISREKREAPSQARGELAAGRPVKKKIEIARPMNKIVEAGPAAPVETSSLPSGVFCSRCGSRVPRESTFCNHCGASMKPASEEVPVVRPEPPRVQVPPEESQVQVPVPPQAGSAAGNQDRPIEQIIHSIEPLIEDSVPRTQPRPLMKKRSPQIISEQVIPESPVETAPAESPAPAEPVPAARPAVTPPVVIWPVLPSTNLATLPGESPVPDQIPPSAPPVPPPPSSKLPGNLSIVLLVIVILAFIAGLIIAANLTPGEAVPGANVTPVKTSLVTTLSTPKPTTLPTVVTTIPLPTGPTPVPIPVNGVWVRVIYAGEFTGMVGTPGNQFTVTDTGDQLYPISTTDGIVAVYIQKKDGTADKLTTEVYKNGVLVKSSSTTAPKGTVEIQFNLKSLQAGNASPPVTA